MKQTFVLGVPACYDGERYSIDAAKATKQWAELKRCYEELGVIVKVVQKCSTHFYDSVYITDDALVVDDFAIMARFNKPARRGEESFVENYLKNNLKLRIYHLPDEPGLHYEGGGDTRWSHNGTHLWFAYGAGRSTLRGDQAVVEVLRKILGNTFTPHFLKIRDKKTFHLDLAFLPLMNGRALYYPTLDPEAVKEIMYVFGRENVVRVPVKYFFACNAVCIDPDTVVAPDLPFKDYRAWFRAAVQMKTIKFVDLSQFHLGDGSVQCMTMRLMKFPSYQRCLVDE